MNCIKFNYKFQWIMKLKKNQYNCQVMDTSHNSIMEKDFKCREKKIWRKGIRLSIF